MSQAQKPGFFVYVSNAADNEIIVLKMASATDAPEVVQTITVKDAAAGGLSTPLAITPDHRFLYMALRTPPLPLASLSIDQNDGRVTQLGSARLPATTPYISTDRSGRFLFCVGNPGATVSLTRIGADGRAETHASQVLHIGHKVHCVVVAESNRFVYVSCTDDGQIFQFRFDAKAGRLEPNDPPAVTLGGGGDPRHMVFSPDGQFLYVTTEAGGHIACFAIDAATGCLAEKKDTGMMPESFSGNPLTADIHLTPDGCFLYASERTLNRIVAYRVDKVSGALSMIDAFPADKVPRSFAIAPDGSFLLSVGEVTGRVSAYAIDGETGRLTKGVDFAGGSRPNWIEIVSLA
jgi:6-phosphogluconolactonase